MMKQTLLEVQNLTKHFQDETFFQRSQKGKTAVDQVDFSISEGEILGLLGTSGCGKTTIARMLCGLEKPDSGKIIYKNEELQDLSAKEYRPYRRRIQMIFQNPFDYLDPCMTIEKQLMEPMGIWKMGNRRERKEQIYDLCRECGISEDCLGKKSSELSGGQLQRIAIIRALLLKPEFLIADEIVSALDVAVQNQVLELLLEMKEKYNLTILFITHDLAVMKKVADRIMVMKDGKILENGTFQELSVQKKQPYFQELWFASYYCTRVGTFGTESAVR